MTIIHFKSFKKMEFSHFLYLESRKNGEFFYYESIFLLRNAISNLCCFRFFAFPISKSKAILKIGDAAFRNSANKQSSSWQSPVPLFCTFVLSSRKRERETKNRRLFYLHTHDHEQLYKTRKCIKSSNVASKPL